MSYKYGHLVAQAIESVLNQTRKPKKIWVVDDGIGDVAPNLRGYPVLSIERPFNYGIIENFNDMLFHKVDTERVMFLGADNWLDPEAIERMERKKHDIVSCDAWLVKDGKYEKWELPHQPHGSALYNVDKAREVGGYESSGRAQTEEDSMLFTKMRQAGATFATIRKPLLYYRKHRWNFNQ